MNINFSKQQVAVLNDVLWEIQESRVYVDDDLIALEELQEMFSYENKDKFIENQKPCINCSSFEIRNVLGEVNYTFCPKCGRELEVGI